MLCQSQAKQTGKFCVIYPQSVLKLLAKSLRFRRIAADKLPLSHLGYVATKCLVDCMQNKYCLYYTKLQKIFKPLRVFCCGANGCCPVSNKTKHNSTNFAIRPKTCVQMLFVSHMRMCSYAHIPTLSAFRRQLAFC